MATYIFELEGYSQYKCFDDKTAKAYIENKNCKGKVTICSGATKDEFEGAVIDSSFIVLDKGETPWELVFKWFEPVANC